MTRQTKGQTDRMILDGLNLEFDAKLPDMNCVRPRVTELIKKGLLWELGSTRCAVTNKTVRIVAIPKENERQMSFFDDEFTRQSERTLRQMGGDL